MKDGKWVEGPRQVLGIATYDPAGKKIDSVAYPLEATTLPGKQHFIYDDKGNVVERILRSNDGLMLSKEVYQYEFDQLGNWTKMSTSVAVFENGEISFEPTGVTYRTISYYYNRAIEELNAASPNSTEAPSNSLTRFPTPSKWSTDSAGSSTPSSALVSSTTQQLSGGVNAHAKKEPLSTPASVLPAKNSTPESDAALGASADSPTNPDDAPATNVVQHVPEDVLRNAAIELPRPEYSDAARLARASGKVKVQILVDANGYVTNAQATAGHPLLTAAAEAAARKARFSLPKASSGATKAYGAISYDFAPPGSTNDAVHPAGSAVDRNPPADRSATLDPKPTVDRNPPIDRSATLDPKPTVDRNPLIDRSATLDPNATVDRNATTVDRNPPIDRSATLDPKPTVDRNPLIDRSATLDPNATVDRNATTYDRNPPVERNVTLDRNATVDPKATVDRNATVDPKATVHSNAIVDRNATVDRNPPADRNPSKPDELKPEANPISETAAAVELKPKAPVNHAEAARLFYNKGVTFQASGRFAEAAEAFNQAITVNPNDANAYARLGMAYSALQKHKDAIVVYKMALQTNRRALGAPAYFMWGHSYLAVEKNSDALSAFKQALFIKKAEAIEVEKKETQQYPSLEQLHYSLGIAYLNSRRFNNAIDELKQAVALNAKNAAAHYSLAIAYLSMGNRREAEAHHKTLVSLDSVLAQKITNALVVAGPPPGCRTIACQ
jgi:TonB family protein